MLPVIRDSTAGVMLSSLEASRFLLLAGKLPA
jgi:hypothetical protein